MKTHNTVAMLVAITSIFIVTGMTGCKSTSPITLANQASNELGIPVFFWALDSDQCAKRQLSVLFKEYNSWNDAGKAAIADHFKNTYKAVIVMDSKKPGKTTGEVKSLQLWNNHRYITESKTLVDTRINEAYSMTGVHVERGDEKSPYGNVVTIEPTYSEDQSLRTAYYTYDQDTYDGITDEESLQDAILSNLVWVNTTPTAQPDPCGKLAKIDDLF